MAHIRRLLTPEQKRRKKAGQLPEGEKPRGLWQATVRHPSGQRWSKSDPLKRVVDDWAAEQEAAMRRGEFVDPNAGKLTLGDWWVKWNKTRRVAVATMDKNVSWWRNHIEPKFGTYPLSAIQSWDVEEWVTDLSGRVGAETVASSLRLLSQMLAAAGKHRLINTNPASLVTAPTPPKHVDRFLTRDEADVLLEQLSGEDRVFVEMMLYCGLRFQEAAGLRRFRVDLLRRRIQIAKVQPRKGTEKKPKTDAGVRLVPLTDDLTLQLSRLIPEPNEELVFTSPLGQRIRYDNWLRRVWQPALLKARLLDPQPTPHDLRHTYGSWLGEANVPPKQIATLMGHAGLRSVERYIHATEARFDQARAALEGVSTEDAKALGERRQ
jgi:integrase